MGRNKIEKDFSEKLRQREINPSANAWDRLDAMLTVAEENKPKRNFGWMYIAASVVGFLLIGTIFLSTTEELIDSRRNDVVFENENPKPETNESEITPEQPEVLATSETIIAKDSNNHPKTRAILNIKKVANESQLAQNTINQPETSVSNNQSRDFGTIINQKTDIKKAVANGLQADELLAMAQTKSDAGAATTSVKVNAKNLLSEVDGELNQTFREKVINSVGKNYRSAKSALANRNQLEEDNH